MSLVEKKCNISYIQIGYATEFSPWRIDVNVYSKNWCTGASIFMKGHIGYYIGFLSDRIEIKNRLPGKYIFHSQFLFR